MGIILWILVIEYWWIFLIVISAISFLLWYIKEFLQQSNPCSDTGIFYCLESCSILKLQSLPKAITVSFRPRSDATRNTKTQTPGKCSRDISDFICPCQYFISLTDFPALYRRSRRLSTIYAVSVFFMMVYLTVSVEPLTVKGFYLTGRDNLLGFYLNREDCKPLMKDCKPIVNRM